MCLAKDTIDLSQLVFLVLSLIVPIFYVISCYLNSKKRKKIKKHLLLGMGILIIMFLLQYGIGHLPKCQPERDIPVDSKHGEYIKTTDKGYILTQKDGAYYIDGFLIVNRSYPLANTWVPPNPHTPITEERCKTCLDNDAYEAWLQMYSDAAAIGLNLYIASGYRSYNYQKEIYEGYVKKDGVEKTDTYSARPGHSEHQSGLTFDLNSVEDSFAATPEGKWVEESAYHYGFIIRYPQNKSDETGYKYEPWHLRYVGHKLAKALYNNGDWLTMEDYFGLESKYS